VFNGSPGGIFDKHQVGPVYELWINSFFSGPEIKKGEKTCKETNIIEKGLFAICRKSPSIEMISSF